MAYNFDQIFDRDGTNSIKWNYRKEVFGTDVLPLWVADMDFPCPPEVVEAIQKRAQHPIYGYPGKPEAFFQSVVDWVGRRFETEIKQDWMTTTPGVVPGLHIAIEAFTSPGDKVIIQPPVYHPFFDSVKNRGRHVVENPLLEQNGDYVMDFDDLKRKIDERTKMLILCNPHNPVGRVWARNELEELAEVCKQQDIVVISDEIHADLVFEKGAHVPFHSLPEELSNQSLTFMSPSKTFNLAGLLSSIAIAENPRVLQQFQTALEKAGLGLLNVFGIEAFTAAYNNGEQWLEELLVYLKANAEYINGFLTERIPQLKMSLPQATYLGWIDFRALPLNGKGLNDFIIHEAKLGLNDGGAFGVQGEGFQRINFACPRTTLEEAMARLERAVKKNE